MTSCVLCSASQEHVVCSICSNQMGALFPGCRKTPDQVADLPAIRAAGMALKLQLSHGYA